MEVEMLVDSPASSSNSSLSSEPASYTSSAPPSLMSRQSTASTITLDSPSSTPTLLAVDENGLLMRRSSTVTFAPLPETDTERPRRYQLGVAARSAVIQQKRAARAAREAERERKASTTKSPAGTPRNSKHYHHHLEQEKHTPLGDDDHLRTIIRSGATSSPDAIEVVTRAVRDAGRSLLRVARMQSSLSPSARRREFVESIGKFSEKGGRVLDVYRHADDYMLDEDEGDSTEGKGAVWEEEIPNDFLQRFAAAAKA